MRKLTLQTAQEFHTQCMNTISDKDFRNFISQHSKNVGRIAAAIMPKQTDFFTIAGLIHDCGYCIEKENHAKHSLTLLEKEGFELSKPMKDCVLNHGSSATTTTDEGKVFQLADKLSMFDVDLVISWIAKFPDPFSKEFLLFIQKKVRKLDQLF